MAGKFKMLHVLTGASAGAAALAIAAAFLSAAVVVGSPTPVAAKGETPTTTTPVPRKCRKYAVGSQARANCIAGSSSLMETEDLYTIGYWMAKRGEYANAIEVLKTVEASNDPRVLTYIGFSMRKLGDVDNALGYYDRALTIDPQFVVAREYLGEAFLQKGDLAAATAQLDLIRGTCGTTCEEYTELDAAIADYRKAQSL